TASVIGSTVGSGTTDGSTFTVTNRGSDIWGTTDQLTLMHTMWDGDGQLAARVQSVSNTNPWAKAGVMYRTSLNINSAHVTVVVTPGKGVAMQYRPTTGGTSAMAAQLLGITAPTTVRLDRSGNTFTGYWSSDGSVWHQLGIVTIAMPAELFVGLAL